MSFNAWWAQYEKDSDGIMYFADATEAAWNASRVESEAELRAPMDCNHPRACWIEPDWVAQISAGHDKGVVHGGCCSSCAQIAALQSGRGSAVRNALRMATSHLNDPLLSSCLCEWCQLTRALLSTPASGEPARKPVELKPRTFTEVAEHFTKVTKPVDWPTDEPDID